MPEPVYWRAPEPNGDDTETRNPPRRSKYLARWPAPLRAIVWCCALLILFPVGTILVVQDHQTRKYFGWAALIVFGLLAVLVVVGLIVGPQSKIMK